MQRVLGVVGAMAVEAGRGVPLGRGVAAALAGFAMVVLGAAPATADTKAVEPYFVVVTAEVAPMKASDGNLYYAVRELKKGEVVRVDGEGPGWLRVQYPPGTKAYAKVDDVSAGKDGKTATLTRPSGLMSANSKGSRPWWPLLEQSLPAGTVLQNAEPVKGADGTIEGYLVTAPPGAHGYVKADQVRRATPEEAATYAGAEPAPAKPAEQPRVNQPGTGTTVPSTPPPATPGTSGATTQPPPATGSVPTPASQPADGGRTGEPAVTDPVPANSDPNPAPGAVAPAPEVTRPVEDLETLRDMFDRVMKPGADQTEIETVVREFERRTESASDQRVRRGLQQRLEAVRLRAEIRESARRAQERMGSVDDRTRQVRDMVEQVEKQAIYTIVGRMLPSTVYNGQRGLPLMYRIESADASSARTIGYVVPRGTDTDLLTKVGKVVGIRGDARYDEALRLNIIAARRIDVLNVGATGAAAPAGKDGSSEPERPAETPADDGNDGGGEGGT